MKGHFLLLSNQTKRHVFWNSVGMRTQNRFTPQVRKTAFIVMNFLLQKEDKSETKYASRTKEKKMAGFSFLPGMRSFIFKRVGSEPEYRLSTKMKRSLAISQAASQQEVLCWNSAKTPLLSMRVNRNLTISRYVWKNNATGQRRRGWKT